MSQPPLSPSSSITTSSTGETSCFISKQSPLSCCLNCCCYPTATHRLLPMNASRTLYNGPLAKSKNVCRLLSLPSFHTLQSVSCVYGNVFTDLFHKCLHLLSPWLSSCYYTVFLLYCSVRVIHYSCPCSLSTCVLFFSTHYQHQHYHYW